MSSFNKKYDGNANNIVTNTIVFPGVEIELINLTDFIITNTDGNTNFTMRAPSEGVNL